MVFWGPRRFAWRGARWPGQVFTVFWARCPVIARMCPVFGQMCPLFGPNHPKCVHFFPPNTPNVSTWHANVSTRTGQGEGERGTGRRCGRTRNWGAGIKVGGWWMATSQTVRGAGCGVADIYWRAGFTSGGCPTVNGCDAGRVLRSAERGLDFGSGQPRPRHRTTGRTGAG